MSDVWMRRLMIQAYAFVAGVAVGKLHPLPDARVPGAYALFVVLLLVSLFGFVRAKRGRFPVMAATLLFAISSFLLGWGRFSQKYNVDDPGHISKYTVASWKERTSVEGIIITDPEVFADRVTFTLNPIRARRDEAESEYEDIGGGLVEVTIRRSAREYYETFGKSQVYGWRVQVNAPLLAPPAEMNPGGFSYRDFLADQDIYGTQSIAVAWGSPPPVVVLDQGEGFFFTEWALALKERILQVFVQTIPYPQSTFLGGVTIGYRSALEKVMCIVKGHDRSVLDECRIAGVTHVLAVSGQHVTIISGMLFAVLTALRIPLRIQAPVIIAVLFTFLVITGNSPSAMRATLMNSLTIFFLALSGGSLQTSALFGIAEAAFIVLFINPKNITQPSFTLSFAAVLSLALISWPLERALARLRGPFLLLAGALALILTVSFTQPFFDVATRPTLYIPALMVFGAAAWWCRALMARGALSSWSYERLPVALRFFIVAQGAILLGMMIPLSSFYFGRMSLAGPYANMIAIPLTGVIVPLGLMAGLVGLIPGFGMFMALVLNATNNVLCKMFFYTAHFSTTWFPYPFVENLTVGRLALYYAVLAVFVWWEHLFNIGKDIYIKYYRFARDPTTRRKITTMTAVAALVTLGLAAKAWRREPVIEPGRLRVTFFSVPFGSAAVVLSPTGRTYLIDGGLNNRETHSDVGEKVLAPYLLKQGLKTVDAVITTSIGPEHTEGLATVFDGFRVERWFDPAPIADFKGFSSRVARGADGAYDDFLNAIGDPYLQKARQAHHVRRIFDAYAALARTAEKRGIAHARAEEGVAVEESTVNGRAFRMRFLAPGEFFEDHRDQSAVLRVEYGKISILFPGDIGHAGVERLRRPDAAADILVAPGHAASPIARRSDMLHAVSPRAIVIQAGNFKQLYGKSREAKPLVDRAKEDYDAAMAVYKDAVGEDRVYDTQRDGAVVVETDGLTYTVSTLKGHSSE